MAGGSQPDKEQVARNLQEVRERVSRAAVESGRRPEAVRLVAVSKGVSPEVIRFAVESGVTDLGENRVQEGEAKKAALASACLPVRWHMVGHLQTNKAGKAAFLFDVIQSVDSLRVARALSDARSRISTGVRLDVLVQVNVAGRAGQHGLPPEAVPDLVRQVAAMEGLGVRGLMTIAPLVDDPEEVRPVFRHLARLAQAVGKQGIPGVSMDILSMGMSQDFEVAVSEGANLIRVGTAIFGSRGG